MQTMLQNNGMKQQIYFTIFILDIPIFVYIPRLLQETPPPQYVPVYHNSNAYPLSFCIHSYMKMEQTQCFEMSAIKHLTPENNSKDYTRH
jgi:hypothetical protein